MLVQQLNEFDPNPPAFEKISESLKKNALLHKSVSYDPSRLNPESLTQLYLRLMKEEAKLELERAESARDSRDGGRNGQRLMSPLLDTVSEASRHTKLIQPLLDRVYILYKNHAIKQIEDEESKYRSLQRDIQEINRGEWDARLQFGGISSRRDAEEGVKPVQTVLRHESEGGKNRPENVLQPAKNPPRNGESATTPPIQESKGLVDSNIKNALKPIEPSIVKVPKEKTIVLGSVQQPAAPSPQLPEEEPTALPRVEVIASSQAPPKNELQPLPEIESNVTRSSIALHEKVIPFAPSQPAQNSRFPSNSPDVNPPMQRPPASPDVNPPVQHTSNSPDVNTPAQHPPASPDVNPPMQHPPASPDVNPPVQHPPDPPDVDPAVQHPPISPNVIQPMQHPPAPPFIHQLVSHPPAASDANRQIPNPAPFVDTSQRVSYHPPSPDVCKRNSQPPPPPSPDTSQRIPHHLTSPAANQRASFPPPQPQAVTPSSASPHPQKLSVPSPDRSPQSTITLPPLTGVLRSTVSPLVPLETLADMAGQQPYKQINSIRGGHPAVVQPHPIQLPAPRNYTPPVYPYYDTQQSYGAPYSTYGHSPIPSYHHTNPHTMPPYQGTASSPNRGLVYGNVPYYSHPTPSYSQYPAYSQNSSFQTPVQNHYNLNPAPRFHDIHTPLPGGSGRSRPPRPSPINTSTTSTRWKNVEVPGSVRSPASPKRPGPGEISPLSERSASPFPETLPETFPHQSMQIDSPTSTKGGGRGGRGRARGRGKGGSVRGRGRSGRAGSIFPTIATSTIPDSAHARTSSHSILSHTEDASIDNKTSTKHELVATPTDNKTSTNHELVATTTDDKISTNPELVATPTDDMTSMKPELAATLTHDKTSTYHELVPTPAGDEDSPATETTADEESRQSVRQSTRPRRATLRSLDNAELDLPNKKRKLSPPESLVRSPSPSSNSNISRPNFILGSRNFVRTSATIMNDISAHKLASLFAKPLTDRDAPGYKNLIYRPQDLKSLKSAIGAGSRALAAAVDGSGAADAGSPITQLGGMTPSNNVRSSTVWIPATVDVVPPKGIVNSAQLEKELMRMFANAVMFNPDPKRGFGPTFRERSGHDRHHLQFGEIGLAGHNDKSHEEEEHPVIATEDEEEGGVVKDAREMYAAVERSVTNWRAAERAVESSAAAAAAAAIAAAAAAAASASAAAASAAAGPLGSGGLLGSAVKGSMSRLRGGADESAGASETGGVSAVADEEGLDDDITGGKRRRR